MLLILQIIGGLLLLYLAWGVIYQLLYAIAGRWWKAPQWAKTDQENRIAVFIPGYKEDNVIVSTAQTALSQDYPSDKYEVIVIADSFSAETLSHLKALPIRVEEVAFEQSTKSRALNTCMSRLNNEDYDIAVILDADNNMQPDFLRRVNAAHTQGVRVLQGRRAAKNNDTTMAVLDGLSEDINNHILCSGHRAFGLSARLAGSGMAFDYSLFEETMKAVDAIGGFDKELELRLTQQGEKVYYDPLAIVLDEKVRKGDHFSQQRSRWIAAQFHYASRFFPAALVRLFTKGQGDHFNKASQMLLPPRLLTPGILFIGSVFFLLIGLSTLGLLWTLVFSLNILCFLLAMPTYAWRSPYREALLRVPLAFWHALRSLLGLGKANKQFIHTPHGEQ
ncbi:MAG: glycosyltransferase family 2 protein [Bacteroidota bacterium]